MGVNRSGYYKWLSRAGKENRYEQDRLVLTELLQTAHEKHKAMGYHSLASNIRATTGRVFSDNLAHKCCRQAGIRSQSRKYKYHKPGDESLVFENLVHGCWNASKPLELVVSDMTCISNRDTIYEWTFLLDTFNNEIIAYDLTAIRGSTAPYYHCLEVLKQRVGKKEEQKTPVVFHTDQGSVYSSRAFFEAHNDYSIIRSMSRAGTPTDNPIIEALNGWIKEELFLDFNFRHADNPKSILETYIHYFNYDRPSAALGYKSPVQYKTELGFC